MISNLPPDVAVKINELAAYCAERRIGLVVVTGVRDGDGTACSLFCNVSSESKSHALDMAARTIDQAQDYLAAGTN